MFDYVLTGPISGVSAGQYIVGLVAQTVTYFGNPWQPSKDTINHLAAVIAVLITLYFWWRNTQGIHESSDDALKIMYVTTAMVVLLIVWSGTSILLKPESKRLPPSPLPQNLSFNHDAVGWLPDIAPQALHPLPVHTAASESSANTETVSETHFGLPLNAGALLGLVGILIAFGHSFLAMSGEESLAQVNRELEYPKHRNLMRAGLVIFIYSLLFTSLVSFFAYALIPDSLRPQYFDNLISGIAMNLVGPLPLKLLFQVFIVVVGFLMLAGALNTAIIGSNGVLNRVSEDGVLPDWLREPHKRYGTTYRMINLIVLLQLLTIIGSRGNVYVLGEAYAFGVIWSFAFKGLAVLVLRFKDKSPREWKVPLNLPLKHTEIPLGLGVVATLLFSVAAINLITKQVATISGIAFTLVFFLIFTVSERVNERRRGAKAHVEVDQFRVQLQQVVSHQSVAVRPGNTLCLVRDYHTLHHVSKALELTHTGKTDLVVMTVHPLRGPDTGYKDLAEDRVFTEYEQLLFSRVVALAEKAGKHVELLVVPSSDIFQAVAQTAAQLHSSMIMAGASSVVRLTQKPKHQVGFRVIKLNGRMRDFCLGAHAPQMSEEDVNLIHELWLKMTGEPGWEHLHHKDIVSIALALLKQDRKSGEQEALLERIRRDLLQQQTSESAVQVKHPERRGERS
ncbi:MAG: APC family permease [Acidobacteria bacterium]|nr:MAG: APC family permease [Acidobacteriota bacterium]